MSAPIAVDATTGLTSLPFTSSITNPWLVVVPVGMWAKASISLLSELAREAGGSAAGRHRRSSTYPQAFLVNSPRCAITEALVLALRVVKIQPSTNTGPGLGNSRISVEVDLLVFEATPQSLDKDVVHAPAPRFRE